jgi:hypothetical protein
MKSIQNILIVSHTEVFKGGSERSNLKLAKDFVVNNFQVSFLIPKLQNNSFYNGFDVINTPKFNFQKKKQKVNFWIFFLIIKSRVRYLIYLFKNKNKFEKYDIIILSTNRTISELIFFKFLKKRCFVINRGVDTKYLLRYVFLNFAEKIFFLNEFKINLVRKYISQKKIKFYHNQIEGEKYFSTNINNVISIGANTQAKGIDRFLDFSKIYKDGKVARFGEGCYELTKYSREKAEHNEIYHFGQIVLMTTRNEDFPRVLLESFHHRKFLISYYWTGIEKFDDFIIFKVKSTNDIVKCLNKIKSLSSSRQNDILDYNETLVHKFYNESPVYKLIKEF